MSEIDISEEACKVSSKEIALAGFPGIAAQILMLCERVAELEQREARLLWVAGAVIGDWPESCGIEECDTQDVLLEAGLLVPSVISEDDMKEDWAVDQGFAIGDSCYRTTPLAEEARSAKKPE